jgi:hypothetical protein
MVMVAVELLVVGLIIVVVAVLARLVWVFRRLDRSSEAQARENAAPADQGDPGVGAAHGHPPVMRGIGAQGLWPPRGRDRHREFVDEFER